MQDTTQCSGESHAAIFSECRHGFIMTCGVMKTSLASTQSAPPGLLKLAFTGKLQGEAVIYCPRDWLVRRTL